MLMNMSMRTADETAVHFIQRSTVLRNNIDIATSQLDRALALLSRLELGDYDPDHHPDVVQAKALLSQAIRTLGGYR